MTGSVVGGDGNRAVVKNSPVSISNTSTTPPAQAEVLAFLRSIEQLLASADGLPRGVKDDLADDLAGATSAIDREEPNPLRAKSRLECMKEALDTVASAAPAAVTIGGMVMKAIELVGRIAA